jgi:transcriptional regulator with XRE-family HTH domain
VVGVPRFAAWLNTTMQHRGYSQADLARTVGVADAQVSRWRRGQVVPSVRYLQRLADTFGVSRATLDTLAGYPVPANFDVDDPAHFAEREAHLARISQLLEQRVPPHLWEAYVDACASLASAFADAHTSIERADSRDMGFRR